MKESESEVLKMEESESELLCTDSRTLLVCLLSGFLFSIFFSFMFREPTFYQAFLFFPLKLKDRVSYPNKTTRKGVVLSVLVVR
jgi:hypothetical protein